MSDFIEQEASEQSPQESSPNTPTVSDSLPDISDVMEEMAQWNTERTKEVLAPWLDEEDNEKERN